MQYIPCNSALLAQETLFLTQKGTFLPKDLQKVGKSRQILIRDKKRMFGLKIFVQVQTFRRVPPVLPVFLVGRAHRYDFCNTHPRCHTPLRGKVMASARFQSHTKPCSSKHSGHSSRAESHSGIPGLQGAESRVGQE